MSVKFQQDTVRDTPTPGGGRKHEVAHEIGERLTGGETAQGYLAVSGVDANHLLLRCQLTNSSELGISEAASIQSSSNQDAHFGLSRSVARGPGVLHRS